MIVTRGLGRPARGALVAFGLALFAAPVALDLDVPAHVARIIQQVALARGVDVSVLTRLVPPRSHATRAETRAATTRTTHPAYWSRTPIATAVSRLLGLPPAASRTPSPVTTARDSALFVVSKTTPSWRYR